MSPTAGLGWLSSAPIQEERLIQPRGVFLSSWIRMSRAEKTRVASGRTWELSITTSLKYSPPLMSDRSEPWNRAAGSTACDTSVSRMSQSKKHADFRCADVNSPCRSLTWSKSTRSPVLIRKLTPSSLHSEKVTSCSWARGISAPDIRHPLNVTRVKAASCMSAPEKSLPSTKTSTSRRRPRSAPTNDACTMCDSSIVIPAP